ncbi:G-protein-like protein coupled receptor [Hyaloscypha finlandica]|nr:G-protein-like protein coupled receptor [Hyaloscypha finlandica]
MAPLHATKALSHSQDLAIEVIERIGSSISMACVLFLMSTFLAYQRLRTPSNTLLFSASPANLFAGIASLIGRAGLSRPNAATCQVQGFFLEWFMQADAWWACAGALNVMLVFFYRYNAEQLRRLNPIYWLICYGIPAIPAVFSLIFRKNGKQMYGDATLWCWYSTNYMMVRLYAYYIPIWVVVSLAMIIYTLVGIKIHRNNVLLHSIQATPLSNLCSRTFEHEVTYSAAPPRWSLPGENDLNGASTVTVSAPPFRLGHCAVLKSMFITFLTIWQDDSNFSPSDRTTMAYSRVAFLFFASNLITWVPASVNRVYALLHPTEPSFFLNVFAAIVLPLQGLWNCIIYLVVNKTFFKEIFREWKVKMQRGRKVPDSTTESRDIGVEFNDLVQSDEDEHKMQDLLEALKG